MRLEGEGRWNSGWNRGHLRDGEKEKTKEMLVGWGSEETKEQRCFGLIRGTNERRLELHRGFFGRKVYRERED